MYNSYKEVFYALAGCTLEAKFKRGKVVVQGAKINGQKYKPGSIATFRCKKRYRLIGSMKSLCLEDGEWSGFKAKCIKRKYDHSAVLILKSLGSHQLVLEIPIQKGPRICPIASSINMNCPLF